MAVTPLSIPKAELSCNYSFCSKSFENTGEGALLYTGLFSPSAVQLGVSPGSGDFRNKHEEQTSQLWKHLPGLPVMYLPASKTFQKSVKYNTFL